MFISQFTDKYVLILLFSHVFPYFSVTRPSWRLMWIAVCAHLYHIWQYELSRPYTQFSKLPPSPILIFISIFLDLFCHKKLYFFFNYAVMAVDVNLCLRAFVSHLTIRTFSSLNIIQQTTPSPILIFIPIFPFFFPNKVNILRPWARTYCLRSSAYDTRKSYLR